MTTSKSRFKQLLHSNQDQIKISLNVKIVVVLTFMCLIIKIIYLKYWPVYKMAVLSKSKSDSNVIDYFKELSFYNKPIEKPEVKHLKDIDQSI